MMDIDVNKYREAHILSNHDIGFEVSYNFFYDETGNIRKYHVREDGFNVSSNLSFVLGGIAFDGPPQDVTDLFNELRLDPSMKELKFGYVAKGDFLSCLKSERLPFFFRYLLDNNIYMHYSVVNVLYYSLVDIVDSAISIFPEGSKLGLQIINNLKNVLYVLAKREIDVIASLFYRHKYPNISNNSVISFIDDLYFLFDKYAEDEDYSFWIKFLKDLLDNCKKKKVLTLLEDEVDHVMVGDFLQFYIKPIYLFKNSTHVFDEESEIMSKVSDHIFMDNNNQLDILSFQNSSSNPYIQMSDILVGFIGRFSDYIINSSLTDISRDLSKMTTKQHECLDSYLALINKSHDKNKAFLHEVNAITEHDKKVFILDTKGYL